MHEVRLLKEVKLDERQAVKYMDFLQLIRTIRDETEKHQCSHPSYSAAAVACFVLPSFALSLLGSVCLRNSLWFLPDPSELPLWPVTLTCSR